MTGTKPDRMQRLTGRWLRDQGNGLALLDLPAFSLLGQRLLARRRAVRAMWTGALVAFAAVTVLSEQGLTTTREDGTTPWSATAGWSLLVAVLALVGGGLLTSAIQARADRSLAATLPRRVSRSTPVRLIDVAGRRFVVAAPVTALVGAVLAVLAWFLAPGWPAVTVTIGCFVAVAGCTAVVAVALRRPAVAFDAVTLAIDERLRRADVVLGAQLLVVCLVLVNALRFFIVVPGAPERPAMAWLVSLLPVMVLQFALTLPHIWPGPPYPGALVAAGYLPPPPVEAP